MSKVFLKRGSVYTPSEGNFSIMSTLDDGIYQIHQEPMSGALFLERIGETFTFGFKLYGIDEKLVGHVIDTYNKQSVKRNIGVLLNGAKGTGKTVTAKLIANRLGLPVIICDSPYPGLAQFLASINHDCVFFFDEFEKNFRVDCGNDENCAGEDLLSIMDGVYNTESCHVFLLTTNELKVNTNLLCRPARIRYLKSFGDVIDKKILEEYIDDNLIKKDVYKTELIEFIDTLEIATIDIVKSLVDEVNLHDVHIDEFKSFFNVKEAKYIYSTRTWVFDVRSGDGDDISKEEFFRRMNIKYTDPEYENHRIPYNTYEVNKPFGKIKKGDNFGPICNNWFVHDIDYEKKYLICRSKTRQSRYMHVFIENPDVKPSLYDDTTRIYVDPYWGYSD